MIDKKENRGIVLPYIIPLNGPSKNLMRPLTCFAGERARIERHADIAQCNVIVSMCGEVVSFVTTVRKGADLVKRADRGAEGGALCHIAGAVVKVAHCQFI